MNTLPFAVLSARGAVARGLVGAHAADPVEEYVDPRPTPVRIPRSRTALATVLRRMADSVAPAEPCSAR